MKILKTLLSITAMLENLNKAFENIKKLDGQDVINIIQKQMGALAQFAGSEIATQLIKNLKDDVATKDEKNLKRCYLLTEIASYLASELKTQNVDSKDVFKGSHVIIKDGGNLYKKFKELGTELARERISSHHRGKKTPDLGIGSEYAFPELLVGTTKDGNTYLQFEGSPVKDLRSFISHMMDFVLYVITGKNIGPYGRSEHTEHTNPIVLMPKYIEPAVPPTQGQTKA
ncbi:hypothetical protein MIDIC_410019 [Alphaproteobacteria bacterium]